MIDLLPLTASGVEVPDRTPGQLYMTVLLVVLFIAALAIAYRRNKFSKLPKEQRKHKSTLLGSIRNRTPETVRIPRGADPQEYREALLEAFERAYERARGGDADHDPDRITIREATATVARELHEATGERLPTIPRAARRVGGVAILVALLGAVAVSTETIVRLLTEDRGGVGVGGLLSDAAWLTQTVLTTVIDGLAMFPGGAFLANFVFAYGVLAATLAYHHWYVLAVALAIGALVVTLLDRRIPDDVDAGIYYHRETLAIEVVGAAAVVWLAGIVPTGLGQLVGTISVAGRSFNIAAVGAAIGALFALVVLGLVGRYAARSLYKRLRHAATIDWAGGPDSAVAAYLIARYCATGLALVAVPLLPVYALVALVDGRLFQVLAALVAADAATQLLILTAIAVVGGCIAYLARDAGEDVRAALTETFARQSVRVAILQRGLTVGTFIGTYSIIWAFTRSYWLAPVGAILIAIAVYIAYEGVDRAAYRLEMFGRDSSSETGVLIQAYVAEDADYDAEGDDSADHLHPVAAVGSDHYTARESIDATVDDALMMADAVGSRNETVPATPGQQHADDLLELGLVGADVETELQESIRQTIRYDLKPRGKTTMGSLEKALKGYPEDVWRGELKRYQLLNIVSINGETVRLERDVWAVDDHETASQRFFGSSS